MAMLATPEELPSARVLRDLRARKQTFFDYTLELASQHEQYFRERPLRSGLRDHFIGLAANSHAEQAALESSDRLDFDAYIARYFAEPDAQTVA
jgi:glutamate--cysteine ligase